MKAYATRPWWRHAVASNDNAPPRYVVDETVDVRCPHVDGDGLGCVRFVGHDGPHRTDRWEWNEDTGERRRVTR